ncbi:MAG: biosynthetic-type acetolactate synthase large subunit [Caecibacter massiliensis]|uniref:biosynthetic-type acetolactate synthase large subunit n=1 Tax=unclassified Megasphaera TaxID=2626256 RepID=UPI000ED4523C|nr:MULTISPECIES: biosynthetic-type acetolactate synthase large subunit [unclassified Megasphaera]MCI5531902.1 biosynthetic-type acetolactate synthase large subunit [Caecibacter massiliensis]HAM04132.1 biosynthetic-type acetolactate synthase large subunit [Megasphaera sp.]
MNINGAQAIIECLKKESVSVVFGYPGGTVLTLYDELYKAEFPHILTGHEQGAIHAADGYARATGKTGVCFATSGPGVCNMVTGIATANMDSVPLVIISGQVTTSLIGRDSFQEADISGITTPITKHNYLIKDVEELPHILKEAFYIASTGRPGPVLIDIAKDVFDATLNFKYPKTVHLRGYSGRYIGQEDHVTQAVEALAAAHKPLLLAGGGVILSNTSGYLRSFVEKTQIPVITTLMGKGAVPDSYANHLGMVGMHGSYAANMAVMECDLLLAIGSRFDDRVTGDAENFAPNARIVHFDIDKVEINKIVHADISVGGDLRWSLPLLANQVQQGRTPYKKQYQEWRNHVLAMKKDHPFACRHLENQISPEVLIKKLNQRLDDDTIVVTDVGQHQMWAAQFYDTEKPRHFITSGGLGTMGYGLPAAMGAKLACPGQTVLLLSGDGSIMMNCQEFATLADNGIAVKTVVLCNSVLGMVNQWQRMFYHRRYAASLLKKGNRIPAISEAMGVPGFTATTPDTLDEAIEKFLSVPGPALLEVRIPADENVYPMVPGGKRLNEMILEGGSRT